MSARATTTVHVCRHGQVDNPDGILYGRMPGFDLSELGLRMADRLGEYFAHRELTHLRTSPLERAQQTMEPIAHEHPDLDVVVDERVIEAENRFAGKVFNARSRTLLHPSSWWNLRNPLRPSWGEPYTEIAARMRAALADAAAAAGEGGEAVVVAHQLPIWIARLDAEGRPFVHDPRRRQCTLASVTTFTFLHGRPVGVSYAEPCADLLPDKPRKRLLGGKFTAGA